MEPTEIRSIPAHVGGDIRIPGLPAKPLERLRRALSFANPDVVQAKRRGQHAGAMPDRIDALIEEPDGSVRVPRGATKVIRAKLVEDFLQPAYVDERTAGEPFEVPKNVALERARYYQLDGVYEIEKSLQGTIVIPCAGGKTTLGVAAIGKIGRAAIVLVHTEDLLDQWVETIRFCLGVEPGTVKNGATTNAGAPVVVAMVLTLGRVLMTREGLEWIRRFGVCIVDEAHHSPCETFQHVITKIPARVRVGLTATPEREDGMTDLMDWSFGPRLLEIEVQTLIAKGFLMKPEIEFVSSSFVFPYKPKPEQPDARWEARRMAALQKKLVADKERNDLIASIAAGDAKKGETVLVLSNHKAHCRALGRLIYEQGAPCLVLVAKSGKAAKKDRKETIQGMRDGTVQCVIATSLADEGLDVTRLSRVILALPQRAKGPTMQRVGRLMRNHEGKKPILYDVLDPNVDTLCNRADERKRVYKKLGLL